MISLKKMPFGSEARYYRILLPNRSGLAKLMDQSSFSFSTNTLQKSMSLAALSTFRRLGSSTWRVSLKRPTKDRSKTWIERSDSTFGATKKTTSQLLKMKMSAVGKKSMQSFPYRCRMWCLFSTSCEQMWWLSSKSCCHLLTRTRSDTTSLAKWSRWSKKFSNVSCHLTRKTNKRPRKCSKISTKRCSRASIPVFTGRRMNWRRSAWALSSRTISVRWMRTKSGNQSQTQSRQLSCYLSCPSMLAQSLTDSPRLSWIRKSRTRIKS